MKMLVSFLIAVGVSTITHIISQVINTHDLGWNNFIWWVGGATSVFIIMLLWLTK